MPRKSRATGLAEVPIAGSIGVGDYPGALALALGEWRRARVAVLGDLVEAIAVRCHPAPIAGRTALAFQRAWMRLAESKPSPVAIGTLAATLGKNVPIAKIRNYVDRDIRRYKAFLDRVAALARLPHDPRIASAILEVLERAPWSIESGRRIYQPAVDLAADTADERSVPRLRAIVAQPTSKHALVRAYFAEALPAAAAAIEKRGATVFPTVDHALATQLIATLAPAHTPGRDVDALMTECLAHPDDDAPRVVLADALLERGDPRGEFISLQLRPELDDAQRKRAGALLRAHEKDWLGDLSTVTKHRVWRRGFLEEAELARNASADRSTWERAATLPQLATVRRLEKGAANATHYQRFVMSKQMRGLRAVTAFSIAMLDGLKDRIVETIEIDTPSLVKALEVLPGAIERTGASRVVLVSSLAPNKLAAQVEMLRSHVAGVGELGVRPTRRNATAWFEDPWPWLCAGLGVAKRSVQFARIQFVAEARGKKLLFEVVPDEDYAWLESLMDAAPSQVVLTTDRDRARRARRP